MTPRIFTRREYLDNVCSHSTYYAQFVTESTKREVLNRFGLETLLQAAKQDNNFNTPITPLKAWDALNSYYHRENYAQAQTPFTLSTEVCILKEAARQLVREVIV